MESLKTIRIPADEIISEFPNWVPSTEWTFKSFLIKHPQIISKNARFISLETYFIDLIFEDEHSLFVVETKAHKNTRPLDDGLAQLQRGCALMERKVSGKRVVPVLAVMYGGNAPFIDDFYRQYMDEQAQKWKMLTTLDDEIAQRKKELAKLEVKVRKLSKKCAELERSVATMKRTWRETWFVKHLDEQLRIELERFQRGG
jgi:uncharacterized coiled-coil protein SlyX